MSLVYVKSGAAGAGTGVDFANAFTTLAAALAAAAATDFILVSHAHAESNTVQITVTLAGHTVFCVDEGTGLLATSAEVLCTGAAAILIRGVGHMYGVNFRANNSSSNSVIIIGNNTTTEDLLLENCSYRLQNITGSRRILLGLIAATSLPSAKITLKNNTFRVGATGQAVVFASGVITLEDCQSDFTDLVPPNIFKAEPNGTAIVKITGYNATGLNTTWWDLTSGSTQVQITMRNCVSSGAAMYTGAIGNLGPKLDAYNVDSGDTSYKSSSDCLYGSIQAEIARVRTGGASDGITPLSWKIVTSSSAGFKVKPVVTPEIFMKNPVAGSPVTLTGQILIDSATALTNEEVWIEVESQASASNPRSAVVSSAKVWPTAAASLPTSSAVWDTTGMANVQKVSVSATFTPLNPGPIIARLYFTRPSATLYVCPKLDRS